MNKNIIKIFLIGIFGVMIGGKLFAQQDPLSTQYFNNYFLINPAYAGMTKDLNCSAGYRLQWAGFDGSPVTYNATGNVSLHQNKMGLGFSAVVDKIGSDKTTEFNTAYAYHIRVDDGGAEMSFGLHAGMINYKSDYSNLQINPNDPKFNNISEFKPNFGAGLLLRNDNYLISIAMPHFLQQSSNPGVSATGLYSKNLYIFSSYLVPLSYRVKFKPSILLRSVKGTPVSIDYCFAFKMDESYTLGVFTRNFNNIGFQALINVGDGLRFGYVFEMPLSSSSSLNFTSHELMCGIRLKVLSFHRAGEVRNY
jgi:type IX secretion system PorP/SprF family membrane protein